MSTLFSRRRALQGLGIGAGMLAAGCASETTEEEELEGTEDAITLTNEGEILRRYKKFVIVVMENRSFDHLFGHLSLPRSEGGEGRTNVNGSRAWRRTPTRISTATRSASTSPRTTRSATSITSGKRVTRSSATARTTASSSPTSVTSSS